MQLPDWKTIQEKTKQELLEKLEESSFDFHLTGSRFFGRAGIAADIDFFAQDSVEIEIFLKGLGFAKLLHRSYNNQQLDVNTAKVYRASEIDIQLVEKLQVKLDLHTWLKENNFTPPKLNAYVWWNEKYSQFFLKRS